VADVRYALDNFDAAIRSLEALSVTDPLTGLPNRREVWPGFREKSLTLGDPSRRTPSSRL
jgi:hypothetical protein